MSWRIGIATGGCVERPIEQVIEEFAGARFRGLEVGTPPRHFDPWHRPQVEAVRSLVRERGMSVVSIHAPFGGILDLSDPNSHHRSAAMGGILQAASVLRDLGGTMVVVHPSDTPRQGADVGSRLQAIAEALSTLSRACSGIGLRLAIESPLPHLIGGSPDEFAWILNRVDGDAGVCLDTSHTFLGGHWHEFVRVAGARLSHVHACDNHGAFDDHLAPGTGVIAWEAVVESLHRAGYEGWIILELACSECAAPRLGAIRGAAERIFGDGSPT